MSPLPKKKKTAEELAALRESLGISSDGPPPDAPGVMGSGNLEAAVPRPPTEKPVETPVESKPLPAARIAQEKPEEPEARIEKSEPVEKVERVEVSGKPSQAPVVLEPAEEEVEARAKPVKSLRKSERLPADKPKKVRSRESGKLPTRGRREAERSRESPAANVSSGRSGKLPTRKHSDEELARLRRAPLPGVEAPAVHLANQTAGPLALVAIYGVGFLLLVLAMLGGIAGGMSRFDLPFEWLQDAVVLPHYRMILFGVMSGGVGVMLIGAAWIFFKKPISQYHAAILTIIAVLVLVFGTLYFFPGLHGA
ncbi:hypothetical protein [Haloferula sp.]|uniref:hypothetical protein n=1 Tax=Haloferula sp. TaxID=2497595 RepID=UPI003C714F84